MDRILSIGISNQMNGLQGQPVPLSQIVEDAETLKQTIPCQQRASVGLEQDSMKNVVLFCGSTRKELQA